MRLWFWKARQLPREVKTRLRFRRFEHDCVGCVYLGRFQGRDLYFCAIPQTTVISRNSSEGGDYSSGMTFAEGPHAMPRMAEALRRAKARGLA